MNAKARALGHLENVNTFCDNLEHAMAQLGKNYSPSNIYNFCKKEFVFLSKQKNTNHPKIILYYKVK